MTDHSNSWIAPHNHPKVLVRSEQSDGRVSVIESVMPAGASGPPLHVHDFDETFYVLDGELTFQVEQELIVAGPGELAFAPGGVPHTLANRGDASARFLIVCTPAGFEREFARRAARRVGADPPDWALKPIPAVTRVGPPIGAPGVTVSVSDIESLGRASDAVESCAGRAADVQRARSFFGELLRVAAKNPETRLRRIDKAIQMLREGRKRWQPTQVSTHRRAPAAASPLHAAMPVCNKAK